MRKHVTEGWLRPHTHVASPNNFTRMSVSGSFFQDQLPSAVAFPAALWYDVLPVFVVRHFGLWLWYEVLPVVLV